MSHDLQSRLVDHGDACVAIADQLAAGIPFLWEPHASLQARRVKRLRVLAMRCYQASERLLWSRAHRLTEPSDGAYLWRATA